MDNITTALQTFAADQDARELRIMALLDDARTVAVDAGAQSVSSDLFESLDDDDADEALAEFSFTPTATDVPANYRNLIQVCRFDAVRLAA